MGLPGQNNTESKGRKPEYYVSVKRDRGEEKPHWTTIGAGWVTKSGEGIYLRLDAAPITGEVYVMPNKDKEEKK